MKSSFSSLLSLSVWCVADAFVAPKIARANTQFSTGTSLFETAESDVDEPAMNPDNPNLPELKGDFDWDEKFGGDEDWITENVPGKIVLNEIELAQQVTALGQLEEKWRKERLREEYEEFKTVGFVENAELLNSRFAMFFLATGLLTEYWTGVSIPGQVEEMLRIGGFIGFD
mmetsp:Transcript_1079/g.1691  ORF Transcript_1079/g.1691 Transcript_1079/m.1691 type:complete len:172 (-) Transcript_1079:782-1297(-)